VPHCFCRALAPLVFNAAALCYLIRGHALSTTPSYAPTTVSLADEEAVRRILVDTLFGLWATVNNLTRLRPSRHERYRVTVFGSARTEPGHWVYEEVKQMCSALSAMNCDIITGGGPGLMQAANEGARAAQASKGVQSIGIRVHLPFEQDVNPFVEQAFEHANLFHPAAPLRAHLRRLHRCPGWPRNAARNNDDLAALAGASPARHPAHFRRSHVKGPGRMGKRDDVASRVRAGEPAGHADTVLRGHGGLSGITTHAG